MWLCPENWYERIFDYIFESKSCHERISEYICIQKGDTNIFVSEKWYERIPE